MKRMANIVFVFAGMVLGCAAGGAAVQYATAQPQPPPATQRWQQLCEFGGQELDQLNPHLARRGGEGWELVQVVTRGGLVCFMRAVP